MVITDGYCNIAQKSCFNFVQNFINIVLQYLHIFDILLLSNDCSIIYRCSLGIQPKPHCYYKLYFIMKVSKNIMKKTVNTKTTATVNKSTATAKTTATETANNTKNNVIFAVRGNNSIGTTIIATCGLKQLTSTSHDNTQLILSGKSSINLRKKTCFINATNDDFAILKTANKYDCRENDNSVDGKRPHRVYFDFTELENVCKLLATNKFNCNGFEIV